MVFGENLNLATDDDDDDGCDDDYDLDNADNNDEIVFFIKF